MVSKLIIRKVVENFQHSFQSLRATRKTSALWLTIDLNISLIVKLIQLIRLRLKYFATFSAQLKTSLQKR